MVGSVWSRAPFAARCAAWKMEQCYFLMGFSPEHLPAQCCALPALELLLEVQPKEWRVWRTGGAEGEDPNSH